MPIITAKSLERNISLALIVSTFNQTVTDRLYNGALERLRELKISDDDITIIKVPGAIEIAMTAKQLAQSNQYDAIVALGAVIRGETTHYDYVCEQVSQGTQQISLTYNIPIIFGVLTTENELQALERSGGKHGHKGKEAIDTAVDMISILDQLKCIK